MGQKSGRYDLSQDIYVLTVYLGDYAILQCTLTTESTASQCMEYLSQKVDLNQVEMFGLRYQMKTNDPDNRMMRWVELDKPLRRQLEKWACKPRQVQLAVLYHTPNAFTLTDQMARSYYFFLMKLDVVEGKLTVALEKYINLAAYSLQVEYGDFDPTIHTIDFMQTVPLLPKHICRSAQIQEDLLKRVSAVHERLKGMQPSYAALLYIVDAQQCEGYGEEYFNGKDEDSTEVKIGYSQEGIIIKGSYGAPLKHNHSRMYKSNLLIFGWEHIKDMHAMKRHLNIRLHDGTLVQFTMEDAEMARYVAMLNSTRLIGPDYASLVYTMMPEPTYCSSTQRLPSTKRSKRTSLLQATSMCNLSIHTGCNETQSSKCSPLTSLQQYNKLENGIADASSLSQKQSKMELENVSRNVLSKSTAALNFKNDEEYSSSPGLLYCSTPFLLQNNEQNASSSPENINNMITSITDNDTPKLEFRNFAVLRKRHLADTMTGSSPEIRMTGGTHTIRSKCCSISHALSSPDLLSTCRSSPDLITSILDRYRLAVAEAELAATATAAVTSQKPSHLQHLNGTIQNGIHWQTTKAYGNYVLPSPPPITTTSQTSMNEECQRIEDTATLATKFMVMDVAKAEARKHISKDAAIRPKMCKESLPLISSFSTPKVKSQAQPISYLAQAGHIYYPPSSPLAQTHRIYRQQNGFGSPSEPNLGATYTSNALKLPPLFSANHRYEVIEEDRTPESFVRRVHELCTPCSASKALQIRNSALVISSPRSISSPDVFNNRTKNQISEQLSTSSADSTQSPTIRPVLLNGNDSENIQSPIITNESSVCIVCDKATNICEADFMQNEESLANREHNLNESIEEVSQPSSLRHVMLNGVLQQDVINSHGHFIDLLGVVSMNDHGLSIPTNDQTLKRLMAKLVADDVLDEEFAVIPNRRISASVSTSQKPENMKRNRTRSIVPYEDTRIILHSKQSNPTGYINASNIQIPVGGQILKYILTQAPLPDTIEDFWQMVWESGSQLIVMLSDAQNLKSTTIPIYWPQKVMDKLRLSDYSLTLLSSTASKHQVTMMFQLKHDTSGERRIIYHLRLMDWESGKIPPNEESFLGFMDAVNSVRRYLENEQLKELNLTDPTNRNRTQLTDFGYYNWCKKD
ncbi:hypothetical protein DINM_005784 [Dirofilaria immitis]|nr:hypothetical protein [Dirofilaria immitis]